MTEKKTVGFHAILSVPGGKGVVIGFTVELEKGEPLVSEELLESELGKPDYTAYPATRFSDWSVNVWKAKGIAVAVKNG